MSHTIGTPTRHRQVLAGLAAALLIAVPAGTAMGSRSDPRSPDARDAAVQAGRTIHAGTTPTDLRSPDARDAALRASTPAGDAGYVGLRTPVTPAPAVTAATRAVPAPHAGAGPAWGYVALMVAVALAAGMGLNEILRRQRLSRLMTPRA